MSCMTKQFLKGYCNSWEQAGSSTGPGTPPPGITSGKTTSRESQKDVITLQVSTTPFILMQSHKKNY